MYFRHGWEVIVLHWHMNPGSNTHIHTSARTCVHARARTHTAGQRTTTVEMETRGSNFYQKTQTTNRFLHIDASLRKASLWKASLWKACVAICSCTSALSPSPQPNLYVLSFPFHLGIKLARLILVQYKIAQTREAHLGFL